MPPDTTISVKKKMFCLYQKSKPFKAYLTEYKYDREKRKQRMGIPMPSRTEMFGLITSFELTRNMSPI